MGTIKERAAEYIDYAWSNIGEFNEDHTTFENIVGDAFFACAKYEREELTLWHDPKVELPETDVEVLVKIDAPGNKYDIMKHNEQGWWMKSPGGGWCAAEHTPIGWRYIHEN